jgi:hypothetical protein
LYSSPHIIRVIKSRSTRCAARIGRMGEKRNACRLSVGDPERGSPLGRPKRRWNSDIKRDVREKGWGGMD